MSLFEVPLLTDSPLFSERVTLSGKDYVLTFDWNGRVNRWYFNIEDVDGTKLCGSQKIVIGTDIFRHMRWNPLVPGGTLTALDTTGEGDAPLLSDLGRRVKLIYDDET